MRIRLAKEADIPHLKAVEESAAKAFIGSSVGPVVDRTVKPELLQKIVAMRTLWVAVEDDDKPIGFAACYALDGFFYLHEISVAQGHQGKGIGRRLMHAIEEAAYNGGYPYIGLVTFRDIRWNGPFYQSLGYREVPPDRFSGLHNKFKDDIRAGMDGNLRCVMIKLLED